MDFESLDFVYEGPKEEAKRVTVYALSTCGFCKRGLNFLRDRDIPFRYIYINHMDLDEKAELKEQLRKRYNTRLVFPFVVIDDEDTLVGYAMSSWEERFDALKQKG
ncbi:MAG: glutaredoxin family protein [Spirochaetales bacterium]|nr:glutaredoxin family protein [Spirochaetales bacterium]MCF7938088.1 glutaredoxin family protein [Spirochaetales bacterium]